MPKSTGHFTSKLYIIKDCGTLEGRAPSDHQLREVAALARAIAHENPGRQMHIFFASNNSLVADGLASAIPERSVLQHMNALHQLDRGDRMADPVVRETLKNIVRSRPGEVLVTISGNPSVIMEVLRQRHTNPWNFATLDVAALTINGHGQIVDSLEFRGTRLQEEQAARQRDQHRPRRSAS